MAVPEVLTNAAIWYGGYDLTGASNEVTFNAARAEKPVSRFGDTVEATYPGATTVGVEAKGFWDSTLDGPQFTQLTAPSATWPMTVCADGGAAGAIAYGIAGYSFNYSAIEAAWGQSLPYRLRVNPQSGTRLSRGLVMLSKAPRTVNTAGPKTQLGSLSSSQKLIVNAHFFNVDGVFRIYVRSDVDSTAGGETDRVTGTDFSDIASEILEVSGPVTDSWWQVNIFKTSGTSVTVAVCAAIVDA